MHHGEPVNIKKDIIPVLEEASERIGSSLVEVAYSIQYSESKLKKELTQSKGPTLNLLLKLSDYFEVTVDSLTTGNLDLKWIEKVKSGNLDIPEKYCFSAGSTVRTLLPILYYVKNFWGDRFYSFILRSLKIPEKALRQPSTKISIQLLNDTCDILKKRGFEENEFVHMGLYVTQIPENSSVAMAFSDTNSWLNIYELLCDEICRLYDHNFNYKIQKMSRNRILFEASPKPERVEDFKTYLIDTREVALYRQGVAAAQPGYLGLPISKILEKKCLHRGSKTSLFELYL